jgi:hypothetical protein
VAGAEAVAELRRRGFSVSARGRVRKLAPSGGWQTTAEAVARRVVECCYHLIPRFAAAATAAATAAAADAANGGFPTFLSRQRSDTAGMRASA